MDKKAEDKEGEDGETKVLIINSLFYFMNIFFQMFLLNDLHLQYVLIVSQCALEEDTGDEEREPVNSTGTHFA